jgi:hypothetical protein
MARDIGSLQGAVPQVTGEGGYAKSIGYPRFCLLQLLKTKLVARALAA